MDKNVLDNITFKLVPDFDEWNENNARNWLEHNQSGYESNFK